jgi:hypothetical protein
MITARNGIHLRILKKITAGFTLAGAGIRDLFQCRLDQARQ